MDKNPCIRVVIKIGGIVQGVGFRPFIYKLAQEMNLLGFVQNTSEGVLIDVEGTPENLAIFIRRIKEEKPVLAYIKELNTSEGLFFGYKDFKIEESLKDKSKFTLISPDVALCKDCARELETQADRRFGYPFINCTNCGPRFSIIKDTPYDRPYTTMAEFPLCDACLAEYNDPENRRFHAQPNACEDCGPKLSLLNHTGQILNLGAETQNRTILKETTKLLKEGYIVAIKGLGGYHLACDARNEQAVTELRKRKFREDKPFAVMVRDLAVVSNLVEINPKEAEILTGFRKPIVLLKKQAGFDLAQEVAPGNSFLGVMLPYTPLHQVLLNQQEGLDILVMTSGNKSSEPILYKDEEAIAALGDIADYFLIHNREIHRRVDDSVVRVWRDQEYLYRRARGYAPYPIVVDYPVKNNILACGGEQKNVFCLNQGQYFFLSHHIGDLENLETLVSFEEGVNDFKKLFNINPQGVAFDLHPEYLSTKYAIEQDLPKIPVQHHHAHVVSCMAEHGLNEKVLGVVFDGTGYGADGKLWGGEFLISDLLKFQRYTHLSYTPLPGGSKAIKEPWRMGVMYLAALLGKENIEQSNFAFLQSISVANLKLMLDAAEKGINAPLTSSMGRLFDGVAAILNIRTHVNYEGQGAIELEQLAWDYLALNSEGNHLSDSGDFTYDQWYPWEFTHDNLINPVQIIKGILADYQWGKSAGEIAFRFHQTVADLIIKVALKVRKERAINKICLSGGVFQNILLLDLAYSQLTTKGFEVFTHRQVPPNDGGIAFGQGIIAEQMLSEGGTQ
jgi:hydrogenase maturation protein HypF